MTCLIHREHDVAATRELDREIGLGFARVEVSVHRQDAGRRGLRGRVRRREQQRAHRSAAGADESHVEHAHAAGRLNGIRQQPAQDHEQCAHDEQRGRAVTADEIGRFIELPLIDRPNPSSCDQVCDQN